MRDSTFSTNSMRCLTDLLATLVTSNQRRSLSRRRI